MEDDYQNRIAGTREMICIYVACDNHCNQLHCITKYSQYAGCIIWTATDLAVYMYM